MDTPQHSGAASESSAANPTQDNFAKTPKSAENTPAKSDVPASGKDAKAQAPAPGKEDEAGEKKLSGAELKKKAKAEKAARRAKEKLEREQQGGGPSGVPQGGQQQQQQQNQPGSSKKGGPGGKGGTPAQSQKRDKQQQQQTGATKNLPIRLEVKKPENTNIVAVFDHLASQKRRSTISGAGKDIHPAILALGLQMTDYVVCGSSARCVATMLALKRVVESYNTPIGTSLTRHLTSHLSHDINYLTLCRPLSVSQGNAIRALKLAIASIDPSSPENEAKRTICDFIDNFIREKITIAGQVIADKAAQKIEDGDVILCYANSNVIRKTLLKAHSQGKKFSVSIVDSRPLFEGKKLARTLADAGLTVRYTLIHGLSHAVRDATKVLLGAHSMTSNGRLFSRVGTALVAMSAKERAGGINIPVIVCCETIKFTDRVALDSIVVNELAEPDDLVASEPTSHVTSLYPQLKPEPSKSKKPADATNESNASSENKSNPLEDWRSKPNLQVLNIMYDVTPADYVDMIITEMGSLPPSSVPVVHRMSTNP